MMILFMLICMLLMLPGFVAAQALDRTHVNYTNPLIYGATCTSATLNATITAVGVARQTLFITKTDRAKASCIWTISANVTTSINTTVYIPSGVVISVNSGITVTFNGPVIVDELNALSGVGSFVFNHPDSFGQSSYIDSGCAPTFTGGSPTLDDIACTARVNLSVKSFQVYQPSATLASLLSSGNNTYWLLFDFSTTRAIAGWTRETGTHYLSRVAATQPANVNGGVIFAKVVLGGGVITSVSETGNRHVTNIEVVAAARSVLPEGTWTVEPGGLIQLDAALTFSGSLIAPLQTIFSGASAITFTSPSRTLAVYPQWWGALGNGSNNDGSAVAKAIASQAATINFNTGNYVIGQALTLLQSQKFIGNGGQRSTTLTKAFNGTLLTGGSLNEIANLNIDMVGGTYTGKGIVIPVSTFSYKLNRLRIVDCPESCIYFAASAGGGTIISELEGNTVTSASIPVIAGAGDAGASPRFINNSWLSGGIIDISGWNDTFISNIFLRHILTSSTTANFYVNNVRWAAGGATITIQGAGGMFTGNSFAGPVLLTNTSGLSFSSGNEFGSTVTETSSTLFNSFYEQGKLFVTTWTQFSGTQPAIGNGVITGRSTREGYLCNVQMIITMGSTTTYGNNAVPYLFQLPYYSQNDVTFIQYFPNAAEVYDSSGTLSYTLNGTIGPSENNVYFGSNGQGLRSGYPVAFAAGDIIKINLTYLTR